MTEATPLIDFLRTARRRLMLQQMLEHAAWGAVAGLSGLLLMLLTGSGIFGWHWPLALASAAAGVSWLRGRRHVPSEFEAARKVDAALEDQDTLATAYHFAGGEAARRAAPEFLEALRARAAGTLAGLDAAALLPVRRPRAAIPVLVLGAAALVLFGVRYGVLQTMDLRAPIAQVMFDTLTGAPAAEEASKRGTPKVNLPQPETLFLPEGERASIAESEMLQEEALKNMEVAANATGQQGEGKDGKRAQESMQGEEGEEGDESGESSSAGDSDRPPGTNDPRNAKGDQAPPKAAQKENSLLNKMRDALANLMDKMKMESQGTDQQQVASNKKAGGQSGEGQKQQSERGSPTKGQSDAKGEPGDENGDPEGDPQQAQNAQAPGQKSSDSPSADQKSGVGQQDGRKDTELAEHAEAMGKLTELMGKRSQQMQGEIMIEVTNSRNQQARTPFERRQTARGEGGESSRDEVPLHLQPYIQQFYEQVRKAAPPAKR